MPPTEADDETITEALKAFYVRHVENKVPMPNAEAEFRVLADRVCDWFERKEQARGLWKEWGRFCKGFSIHKFRRFASMEEFQGDHEIREDALAFVELWRRTMRAEATSFTSLIADTNCHDDAPRLSLQQRDTEDIVLTRTLLEAMLTASLVVDDDEARAQWAIDYECKYLSEMSPQQWTRIVPMCESALAVFVIVQRLQRLLQGADEEAEDRMASLRVDLEHLRQAMVEFIRRNQAWIWTSRILIMHEGMNSIWKDCRHFGKNDGEPKTMAIVTEALELDEEEDRGYYANTLFPRMQNVDVKWLREEFVDNMIRKEAFTTYARTTFLPHEASWPLVTVPIQQGGYELFIAHTHDKVELPWNEALCWFVQDKARQEAAMEQMLCNRRQHGGFDPTPIRLEFVRQLADPFHRPLVLCSAFDMLKSFVKNKLDLQDSPEPMSTKAFFKDVATLEYCHHAHSTTIAATRALCAWIERLAFVLANACKDMVTGIRDTVQMREIWHVQDQIVAPITTEMWAFARQGGSKEVAVFLGRKTLEAFFKLEDYTVTISIRIHTWTIASTYKRVTTAAALADCNVDEEEASERRLRVAAGARSVTSCLPTKLMQWMLKAKIPNVRMDLMDAWFKCFLFEPYLYPAWKASLPTTTEMKANEKNEAWLLKEAERIAKLVRACVSELFVDIITKGVEMIPTLVCKRRAKPREIRRSEPLSKEWVDELPAFLYYELYRLLELQHLWRTTGLDVLERDIRHEARKLLGQDGSNDEKIEKFCSMPQTRLRLERTKLLKSKLQDAIREGWSVTVKETEGKALLYELLQKAGALGRAHFEVFTELYLLLWSKHM